ncbi:MAG TPA: hypothetical protein EYP46_02830 [Hadesarchaea archaeon]|nr:hypothetical protein [Hadesarchaea archaeon]
MKPSVKNVVFDFLFGGLLVAGALFVASLLGPTAGGVLAGAPIRTGGVIFLQYLHQGLDSAAEMTRGVVMAMISNVFFAITIYFVLPRFGIVAGFLAAGVVFLSAVVVLSCLMP